MENLHDVARAILRDCGVYPSSYKVATLASALRATRREAIEQAAKVADALADQYAAQGAHAQWDAVRIAHSIRALSQQQDNSTGADAEPEG